MRIIIFSIFIFTLSLMTTLTYAQGPTVINYQARLSNSSGDPVPDGNYQIIFSIYADSTGGTPLWTEVHPAVHTSSGYFDALLGFTEPIDGHDLFGSGTPYLQIQVGSGPPMAHRFRITSAPRAAISQGVFGDIQTSPGALLLRNPDDESLFHISSDSTGMSFGFKDPNGRKFFDTSGKPGSLGKLTWGLFNPQPEPPGYEAHPLLQASTGPGGEASWVMFNPQPEPPGSDPNRLIEISNNVGGEAGIYMFNPQPEPPGSDPFFGLQSTLNGPTMNFYTPQMGGAIAVNDHPQINIRCDSTASRLLLQGAFNDVGGPADSIGFLMYADSVSSEMRFFKGNNTNLRITTNSNGTSSGYFDDGSEYMGIEPSPYHAGGDINMYDAAGNQTLLLASNGMVSIGTGTHTNILTVKQYSSTDPIADAWTNYSSRRWKTNIQPMQGALDKVMRLNGVTFDWKETGKHDIGLIAEDVGQVVPEIVKYEENGVDAQSVDYARLTALLIEAVKEQQKKINNLENSNSDMIKQIAELQERSLKLESMVNK